MMCFLWMFRMFVILGLLSVAHPALCADPVAPDSEDGTGEGSNSSDAAGTQRPEMWFPVGERLEYSVQWGFLHVAKACVWSEWIEEDGRNLIAIRVTTRTVSFMDKIYPVNDFLESVVDPETFLPLRFSKDLSEGRYRLKEITTFDYATRRAHWKHLLKDSEHDFDIDPDTRDLLSFMFFMRSRKWHPEQESEFRVMADEKLYDLIVRTRKYESFELPGFGKVRSLLVEPEAKFHGLFVRVGRLKVWISDDKRCLCTKGTARVPVGSVRVDLISVSGPGNDEWVTGDSEADETVGNSAKSEQVGKSAGVFRGIYG